MLFIDCRESHLRAFCRQIHQCARIGGWEGGVKPILEMPGFWKRLSLQALPKGGTENIQSFVTFWLWTASLKCCLGFESLKQPINGPHPTQYLSGGYLVSIARIWSDQFSADHFFCLDLLRTLKCLVAHIPSIFR